MMKEERDIYGEKTGGNSDWYVSVRLCQIILCSILTLVLCLSFKTGKADILKKGYEYLTEFSLTEEDVFNATQTLKNLIGFTTDA